MGFTEIRRVRTYRRTFRRNGGRSSKSHWLVRMYAAKERETLVIETAHILSFGLFLCPQAFEKVSVDIGCKRKLTQNSFMQTGLTIGKGADIFTLVSRGHRSDRIPPRESPRRAQLHAYEAKHIVVDPVMVATSGSKLLRDDAVQALTAKLQIGRASCRERV